MMTPTPIYTPDHLDAPAYHLRYSWTGWPSSAPFPEPPSDEVWQDLEEFWENDGLRKLTCKWTPRMLQMTTSATPKVSSVFLAARVKGRLQHALRKADTPVSFSRKISVRSVGNNVTEEVEAYISKQVESEEFVDPRFRDFLQSLIIEDAGVDLSQPTESRSGRYWYNLHVVLLVEGRYRIGDQEQLRTIRDWCVRVAKTKEYAISRLAVMPDHLHLALRGAIEHAPEEIALAFMNNLAYALGQRPIWKNGYYAGTFGEYNMNAVRKPEK